MHSRCLVHQTAPQGCCASVVRGVHDPPWCSEPSERRHDVFVRVVRDACWSEGTAHARFGVVRVVPENGGGQEVGGELWTLDNWWRRRSICYDVGEGNLMLVRCVLHLH